jgi:phage N-6-adenine-methyltransferase
MGYFYTQDLALSSATDQWATPPDLFCALDRIFHFTLDVCASAGNAKCERYFTEEDDGLKQPWTGTCWMNPPYGRTIGKWMRKAWEASQHGATVVCLVPARTDTKWWHDYAANGHIFFFRSRLKFGDAKWCAPFPSTLVTFGPIKRETVRQLRQSIQGLVMVNPFAGGGGTDSRRSHDDAVAT